MSRSGARLLAALGAIAILAALLPGCAVRRSTQAETISALEAKIGRQFSADRIYTDMANALPTHLDQVVQAQGWLDYHNVNAWHFVSGVKVCNRWADIAAGTYDNWWTAQAQNLKAWGYPIYLSFAHEPTVDTAVHPQCGTAAQYVAAYDHLVALFRAQHVTNVTWVWALTSSTFDGAKGGPGIWEPHTYDVVGVDGYNHASDWRSPQAVFQSAEDFATARGKPLFITEIGCDEQAGNPAAKAAWITQAAALFQTWGNVRVVIWTNTGNGGNYFLDSSAESLAAFKAAGENSYYGVRSNRAVDTGAIWGIYSGLSEPG